MTNPDPSAQQPQQPYGQQPQQPYGQQPGLPVKKRKAWYKRWWVWLILAIVLFAIFRGCTDGGSDTSTQPVAPMEEVVQQSGDQVEAEDQQEESATEEVIEETTEEASPAATPVTFTMSGNADQQSDTIVLSGGRVRLAYDFTDSSGVGMVVGAIYLLPEGTDINVDGGIPDVIVSEAGAGETILRRSAGEYYLKVAAANTDYTITLEEQG